MSKGPTACGGALRRWPSRSQPCGARKPALDRPALARLPKLLRRAGYCPKRERTRREDRSTKSRAERRTIGSGGADGAGAAAKPSHTGRRGRGSPVGSLKVRSILRTAYFLIPRLRDQRSDQPFPPTGNQGAPCMSGGTHGTNRDSRSGGPTCVDRVHQYDGNGWSSGRERDAGRHSFVRYTRSRPFRHTLRHRGPSPSAPTSRRAENIHQNRWNERASLISGAPSNPAGNSGSRGALFGFRDHRRQCRIFRELHRHLRRRRSWAAQRSSHEPRPKECRRFGHQQDEWVLGTLGGMDQDHRPSRLAAGGVRRVGNAAGCRSLRRPSRRSPGRTTSPSPRT